MFLRWANAAEVLSVVREGNVLSRRQDTSSGGMSGKTEAAIVIAVVLGFFLCIGLLGTLLLRYLRVRHDEPKYVPGKYLKDKWRNWMPASEKKKRYSSSLQRRSMPPGEMSTSQLNVAGAQPAASTNVDRHTSVRSTITLPSYTLHPRESESVIGRMGERAGDTIIEFPETAEEEEERRDQEMESLYQIRQARRDERTNREERARLRREAQENGDQETLRALREAAQAARRGDHLNAQRSADDLIREHRQTDRSRRVPAVEYSELGVARLDGSRIRASSNASDNAPLLDAAAGMGSGGRPRADTGDSSRSRSRTPGRRLLGHFSNMSRSSLRFTSSDDLPQDHSDDDEATPRPTTRASSRVSMTELDDPGIPRTRSGRIVDPPRYEGADWEEVSLTTSTSPPREPERAATTDSPRQALSRASSSQQTPPTERPPSYPWLDTLGPLPTIEITPFDVTSNSVS